MALLHLLDESIGYMINLIPWECIGYPGRLHARPDVSPCYRVGKNHLFEDLVERVLDSLDSQVYCHYDIVTPVEGSFLFV